MRTAIGKLTLAAALGLAFTSTFFGCGGKSEADFSIVPVKGENGDYQYIDVSQKGKVVVSQQFGKAHIFRDGLALAKVSGKDGKWGYINKKGIFAIAPIYSVAQDFGDGVAWVQIEDQPPMLIDKDGKTVLQIDSIVSAYPFSDGVAKIEVYSKGQKAGMFINKKGEPAASVIEGTVIEEFISDGLYAFQNLETGKWGYKNQKGEKVINEQFDSVDVFTDGIAIVSSNEKHGVIDSKGEFIIEPKYDVLGYSGDGLFTAAIGKKYGLIDKKGKIVSDYLFDFLDLFYGGKLAMVQMGSKYGYINKKGQIAINPRFDFASPFSGGYAMVFNKGVNKDGKAVVNAGFIDKDGNFVVEPLYEMESNDALEYIFAAAQNMRGLPLQYHPDHKYQNGSFWMNKKLEEIKGRQRTEVIEAAKASEGSFTDSRDGKAYKTVKIGWQTWLAENLNYETDGSKCYGDKPENCEKYGRLYDWETAKKACPAGWHLPGNMEWDVLLRLVDGVNGKIHYDSKAAGKHLKAASGWNKYSYKVQSGWGWYGSSYEEKSKSGSGEDTYAFAALPGGAYIGNNFAHIGERGNWWSASERNSDSAYFRGMRYDNESAYGSHFAKATLRSIRCLEGVGAAGNASAQQKAEPKAAEPAAEPEDSTAAETEASEGEPVSAEASAAAAAAQAAAEAAAAQAAAEAEAAAQAAKAAAAAAAEEEEDED